jgi:hypothetical protein
MKKIILSMTFFLSIALLQSCEKEEPSLKDEALTLAKECGITSVSTPDQILEVEKVENELVILRTSIPHLGKDSTTQIVRFYTKVEYAALSCAYKSTVFSDSSYAIASGYWLALNPTKYGGIDSYDPYIFLLTNLDIVDKP